MKFKFFPTVLVVDILYMHACTYVNMKTFPIDIKQKQLIRKRGFSLFFSEIIGEKSKLSPRGTLLHPVAWSSVRVQSC